MAHLVRFICLSFAFFSAQAAHADIIDLSDHGDFRKIYFIPDPTAKTVEVRVFLPVGEADRTGPEGLSHYLEHLVFWSADRVHGTGIRDREANAWASPYWTAYWNRGTAETFENMARNARVVFEPVELSEEFMLTERDVVEREFDLRYRDRPTSILYRDAYHYLYGTHGLGRSVMGTPESLRQISPADALAFHKARYRPQDAYLLIHGNIAEETVIAGIETHFRDMPSPPPVDRGFLAPVPMPPKEVLSLSLKNLERDEALILGHAAAPAGMPPRKLAFSIFLLQDVLNSVHDGGLQKPLYFDDFVVRYVSADLDVLPNGRVGFSLSFGPEDDVPTRESIRRVRAVLEGLAASGLPGEAVTTIRDETVAEVKRRAKERSDYRLDLAARTILNLGEALDVHAYVEELDALTTDDLNLVLKSIAESTFVITAVAKPEGKE